MRIADFCQSYLKNGTETEEINFVFELKSIIEKHPFFTGCKSLNDYE